MMVTAKGSYPCQWCGEESRLFRHVRGVVFQACDEHRYLMPALEEVEKPSPLQCTRAERDFWKERAMKAEADVVYWRDLYLRQ